MSRVNSEPEGNIMKQSATIVDTRIKRFMQERMEEYPELKEKYGPRVEVVQRGYLWEDIVGFFNKKERVQ
jgi:hypothetical protein